MHPILQKAKARPFLLLWLTVFVLYLPAWRAGFVTDAIDWLKDAHTPPFRDYLNRPHSTVHSLYQFTQLTTLVIYKLFGTARLPWHLLMISLQALNGFLLYKFFRQLFEDAGIAGAAAIAFWGSLLFCASPYLSEVIVWKACFHYLQGLLMMLGILRSVQCYIHRPEPKWAWTAGVLFAISSFSLEIFYLTPVFTASLIFFYYNALRWERGSRNRALLLFFVPQVLAFILHLALFHRTYGEWISHSNGGGLAIPIYNHLVTCTKYAFHVLLFGRYWSQAVKEQVYQLCEQPAFLVLCYGLAIILIEYAVYRVRKSAKSRAVLLLFLWVVASTALVLPMPFESLFDLSGNRYLYLTVAFSAMMLALIVSAVRWRPLIAGLAGIWILVSSFLTLRTNRHWQTGTRITESLLKNVPPAAGRTMIMLSLPYCYKGIPMINAFPYGNFQRMHNVLETPAITEKVYDAVAFNMASPNDGTEVAVVNDSTVKVTLLQWGTWWWYKDFGAYSYETPDYRIDMRDQGHWYEIILKRPKNEYLLLYQVGNGWKEVK